MKQVNVRLNPKEAELLNKLRVQYGTIKNTLIHGLKALESNQHKQAA
jgi:hypothetical protein